MIKSKVKLIASFLFLGLFSPTQVSAVCCVPYPCDPTINFAMTLEKSFVDNAFVNFKNSIITLKDKTVEEIEFSIKEDYELIRLIERLKVDTIHNEKTAFLFGKLKEQNNISTTLKIQKINSEIRRKASILSELEK